MWQDKWITSLKHPGSKQVTLDLPDFSNTRLFGWLSLSPLVTPL